MNAASTTASRVGFVMYPVTSGSADEARLDLLRVTGLQVLTPVG